jgi:NADH-quinone oxidoreductase subunit E
MLTELEKKEIEAEIRKYPQKRAVAPDALKVIQKYRGWVSDEALKDVADFLEMTEEELDSISTFYSMIFRKPVGKHVILMCDSISCWITGYENLYSYLAVKLGITFGQTTPDGLFTLLPITCLGACDKAPAMMIDDKLYVNLDAAKIDMILAEHK